MESSSKAIQLPFKKTICVRYSDADQQGHLYFANYLIYADEATCYFMDELGFSAFNVNEVPCFLFTVNVNCDYLGECNSGDAVEVSVGYSRIGSSSADIAFELFLRDSDKPLARGTFTQVFVDKETRKSCEIPEFYRAAIMKCQPELAAS